jgi:phosphoribosyl 1,2-cyclic phosphodiesterase
MYARMHIDPSQVYSFSANIPIQVGGLSVTAFPKFHDAGDPHSFVVSGNSVRVGVFTDIGIACPEVIRYFKQCHAAFLEANYDIDMLNNSGYPYYLKQRIIGGKGHLSNLQALQLFQEHRPSYMNHLLLSHLSGNNNCPDLVSNLFSRHAGETKIVVATRFRETGVYHITNETPPAYIRPVYARNPTAAQLSLF